MQRALTCGILDSSTFRIAAWNTVNVTTLFIGVTGVIDTFQSVVSCTPTQLGAAISKNDLTGLAQEESACH